MTASNSRTVADRDSLQPTRAEALPPASFGQYAFFLYQKFYPDDPTYHVWVTIRISGPLDVDRLDAAFDQLATRQPSLRTLLKQVPGARPLRQLVLDAVTIHPVLETLDGADAADAVERRAWSRMTELLTTPFDLAADAPPWRASLLRLNDQDHFLMVVLHHVLADGVSATQIFNELVSHYAALSGIGQPLPPLRASFTEFAERQWDRWDTGAFEKGLTFWKERLRDAAPLVLPAADHPEKVGSSWHAARHSRWIERDREAALRTLAAEKRVTPLTVYIAAFGILCHKRTGLDRFTVCVPSANRPGPRFADVVGCFSNVFMVQIEIEPDDTFSRLVERVGNNMKQAYAHRDLPLSRLKQVLAESPIGEVGMPPRLMIQVRTTPEARQRVVGDVTFEVQVGSESLTGVSHADLFIMFFETADGLCCFMDYRAVVYERETVARLLDDLETILASAAADPETPVAAF